MILSYAYFKLFLLPKFGIKIYCHFKTILVLPLLAKILSKLRDSINFKTLGELHQNENIIKKLHKLVFNYFFNFCANKLSRFCSKH